YVEGVSRSLLTELERHRFLSFSVIAQRYVRQKFKDVVIPPAIDDESPDLDGVSKAEVQAEFLTAMDEAYMHYDYIADYLVHAGLPRKQALEAARSVLPNAAEVKMVVTGNIRAWRDVLQKRWHAAADAEIRQFAGEVLKALREYAPNSVSDIPDRPYGTEES